AGRRNPDLEQRIERFRVARDGERTEPRRRGAQQFLKTGVLIREGERLGEEILVRRAVDVEQTDGGRDRWLGVARGRALQARERFEGAFVADLSERQRRVVLQRTIELGNRRDGIEGVGCLV